MSPRRTLRVCLPVLVAEVPHAVQILTGEPLLTFDTGGDSGGGGAPGGPVAGAVAAAVLAVAAVALWLFVRRRRRSSAASSPRGGAPPALPVPHSQQEGPSHHLRVTQCTLSVSLQVRRPASAPERSCRCRSERGACALPRSAPG